MLKALGKQIMLLGGQTVPKKNSARKEQVFVRFPGR